MDSAITNLRKEEELKDATRVLNVFRIAWAFDRSRYGRNSSSMSRHKTVHEHCRTVQGSDQLLLLAFILAHGLTGIGNLSSDTVEQIVRQHFNTQIQISSVVAQSLSGLLKKEKDKYREVKRYEDFMSALEVTSAVEPPMESSIRPSQLDHFFTRCEGTAKVYRDGEALPFIDLVLDGDPELTATITMSEKFMTLFLRHLLHIPVR